MTKIIVSVLGQDRPGIIAAVARILHARHCNLENVSQTILQSEFAGIFLASTPEAELPGDIEALLKKELDPMGLFARVKPMAPALAPPHATEPFVVTIIGPDKPGLVAGIAAIIADHQVNIVNLQAVFKGGADPTANVMIYEIDLPLELERELFFSALRARAGELGLTANIQHRKIFEAINRI